MTIKVTDNRELELSIRTALCETGGYCPCKIERTPDTKCLCKEFLECEELGACHCGLFVKTEL